MATKGTHDGGWFSVTYEPDQDFKGMSITEFIPVRAVEYLIRTNLALGLTGNKTKRCDSGFNYLTKKLKFNAHLTIPAKSWFAQRNFTGHWRSRLEESGVPIETILGVSVKSTKRAFEEDLADDWIELRYRLNQDFDGMILVECMPLRAYEYLKRTNPSLNMRDSMGKTCTAAFNDLQTAFESSNIKFRAIEWYTSVNTGEWRTVLKEQGTPIEEVLGESVARKKARTEPAIKLLPHFFVVSSGGDCEAYSFDSQDEKRREHVMDDIHKLLNRCANGPVMTRYLLKWLSGNCEEKDIPAEYGEVKELYEAIAPLPNEWVSGFYTVTVVSASTTIISY